MWERRGRVKIVTKEQFGSDIPTSDLTLLGSGFVRSALISARVNIYTNPKASIFARRMHRPRLLGALFRLEARLDRGRIESELSHNGCAAIKIILHQVVSPHCANLPSRIVWRDPNCEKWRAGEGENWSGIRRRIWIGIFLK